MLTIVIDDAVPAGQAFVFSKCGGRYPVIMLGDDPYCPATPADAPFVIKFDGPDAAPPKGGQR